MLALGWSDGLASWASSEMSKLLFIALTEQNYALTDHVGLQEYTNDVHSSRLTYGKHSGVRLNPPSGSSLSLMCCRYVPVSSLTSSVVVMGHSSSSTSLLWILGLSPGEMQQDTEPPIVDLQLICYSQHRFPYNRGGPPS